MRKFRVLALLATVIAIFACGKSKNRGDHVTLGPSNGLAQGNDMSQFLSNKSDSSKPYMISDYVQSGADDTSSGVTKRTYYQLRLFYNPATAPAPANPNSSAPEDVISDADSRTPSAVQAANATPATPRRAPVHPVKPAVPGTYDLFVGGFMTCADGPQNANPAGTKEINVSWQHLTGQAIHGSGGGLTFKDGNNNIVGTVAVTGKAKFRGGISGQGGITVTLAQPVDGAGGKLGTFTFYNSISSKIFFPALNGITQPDQTPAQATTTLNDACKSVKGVASKTITPADASDVKPAAAAPAGKPPTADDLSPELNLPTTDLDTDAPAKPSDA